MTSYFIQKTKLRLPKVDLAIARKLPKLRRYRNVFSRKKEPFLSEKSLFRKEKFVKHQQDVNCSKPNTAIEDPLDVLNLNMFGHVHSRSFLPSFQTKSGIFGAFCHSYHFFCLFPFANTTTYIYDIQNKGYQNFLLGVNFIEANP